MLVNLERAIKSIQENIGFFQPLYEAIINSFQAKANKILISFETNKDNKILGYTVEDDGEGFTKDNIVSFLTYWSDHKITQGALGSGRVMCLKVFENIIIDSQTKDNSEAGIKTKIDFNRKFSANSINDISPQNNSSSTSYTKTIFKNLNEEFLKQNDLETFDIEKIKNEMIIKLLPMFIRFKHEAKEFEIKINQETWLNKENLLNNFEEHKFEKKEFHITVDLAKYDKENNDLKNEKTYTFELHYRIIEDKKNTLVQFYGASDRYIKAFANGVRLEKLKDDWSGIFCLTSKYFEENRVKDSRNDFVIGFGQSNATKENPITFPEINEQLKRKLDEILKEKFPEAEEDLQEKKQKIVESFPHLARYVKKINNLTMSEKSIIKQAQNEFFQETKKVRAEVEKFTSDLKKGKNNFSEKRFNDITSQFTEVGREQLADYIGYRQTIIDMLLEIYDETSRKKTSFNEADIHNLFMPKGNTSNDLFTYANNVWIFDDKFMSYSYAASDTTIAKIVNDVTGKSKESIPSFQQDKKTDLVILYSNPEDEYKDVLLIEFKRLNDGIDGKEKALAQLKKYPLFIRENIQNIRSIFTYTIIDIDEEFITTLKKIEGFQENAFGDKDNVISSYYFYNKEVQAHINVVSFAQVLLDADKRNKVFLDILKQNFNQETRHE